MISEEKCFIVWISGEPDTYRCINASTDEEAVFRWRDKYGPEGDYSVRVTENKTTSSGKTFSVSKKITLKSSY